MRNRNTIIIVLAVAAALVLTCCCVATAGLVLFRADDGETQSPGANSSAYSQEQQALIEDFGEPDTFAVLFGEAAEDEFGEAGAQPVHRVEYWDYWDGRLRVVFRDGRYVRREVLDALPEGSWSYPALTPAQLEQGMEAQAVVDLVGELPQRAAKLDAASGLKLVTVSFGGGQVLATFDDGRLAMLKTLPVKEAE